MFETLFAPLETNGFNIFMIGWIVALAGGALHMIGGGFKEGSSKVPVLGNFEEVKKGQKGYRQQQIAGWVFKFGAAMVVVGGVAHFF
ncbi:hypothetical protein ATL17_2574 [Maritalea mobilis]|uniref:Uncharacterized protein n=1 Tax=Maritalea mobilis TaxID=483324 RepID=A0A4R6VPE7_9HYPH|nr:hypothetical protein [Maritalea mobilis]TDQ61477.1 hypothetical protein ATL17_2574 [Maritalea mobilis]